VHEEVSERVAEAKIMWIELICEDEAIIENNIRVTKLNNPDYVGQDPNQAFADFTTRIAQYTKVYETLDYRTEPYLSYIKSFDAGSRVETFNIRGLKQSKIVSFVSHIHTFPRAVYLCRTGES
jgi:hypothetical protein